MVCSVTSPKYDSVLSYAIGHWTTVGGALVVSGLRYGPMTPKEGKRWRPRVPNDPRPLIPLHGALEGLAQFALRCTTTDALRLGEGWSHVAGSILRHMGFEADDQKEWRLQLPRLSAPWMAVDLCLVPGFWHTPWYGGSIPTTSDTDAFQPGIQLPYLGMVQDVPLAAAVAFRLDHQDTSVLFLAQDPDSFPMPGNEPMGFPFVSVSTVMEDIQKVAVESRTHIHFLADIPVRDRDIPEPAGHTPRILEHVRACAQPAGCELTTFSTFHPIDIRSYDVLSAAWRFHLLLGADLATRDIPHECQAVAEWMVGLPFGASNLKKLFREAKVRRLDRLGVDLGGKFVQAKRFVAGLLDFFDRQWDEWSTLAAHDEDSERIRGILEAVHKDLQTFAGERTFVIPARPTATLVRERLFSLMVAEYTLHLILVQRLVNAVVYASYASVGTMIRCVRAQNTGLSQLQTSWDMTSRTASLPTHYALVPRATYRVSKPV